MGHDLPPREVRPLVEDLFRRESGRLVASLTRFFGSAHLELAEDVVQDTLMKAMHEWPFKGVPDDPVAWLHRVARNGAIDSVRRGSRGLELLKANAPLLRSEWSLALTVDEALREGLIADDQLRMFFACCHPSLPPEQQVALVLKTLCGFSVPEIARAFLTNEETINKRLYRAREAFRALGQLEIPQGSALVARMASVLASIYLLFNEGYSSSEHVDLVREDLIEEALRLCDLLTQHAVTDRPEVHALLALMLYHAARNEARTDAAGGIVLLADQDRSKWDTALIGLADRHLQLASTGHQFTAFHVEAAIAGVHAHARTFADTDWAMLVALYDELLAFKPTPIVRMNRAIAVGRWQGPAAGAQALRAIDGLADNYLYHAALGDLELAQGANSAAVAAFRKALDLVPSPVTRKLIAEKLRRAGGEAP